MNKFDLSNDDFFERLEAYGIALKPKNGHSVRIPGYGSNTDGKEMSRNRLLIFGQNTTFLYSRQYYKYRII